MKASKSTKASAKKPAAKPTLLAGGNPQIAKADGDAPVQAYIAAMPAWKSDVGRRLDALIARTCPGVRKAVKWNSPFYGIAGQGWFLGSSLDGNARRAIDIHEGEEVDESAFKELVRRAVALNSSGKSKPSKKAKA